MCILCIHYYYYVGFATTCWSSKNSPCLRGLDCLRVLILSVTKISCKFLFFLICSNDCVVVQGLVHMKAAEYEDTVDVLPKDMF